MKNKTIDIKFIIASLSLAILTYVVFRAINLSITHDEAFTYTRYVNHTYAEIVTYQTGSILPNNHILNTVCQKFFSEIFGPHEFVLRLGNILCCIVFLSVSYCFCRQFTGIIALASFVILTMHPYVLDFMGLSRGYGMAFTFMLLSLFCFFRSIKKEFNPGDFSLGLLAAVLAIWANFSLLNYLLVVSPLFLLMQIIFSNRQTRPDWLRRFILNTGSFIVSCLVLRIIIYGPLKIILDRKLLFGGEKGFWSDTVISLCERLGYGANYQHYWIIFLQVLILVILIGAFVQIIYTIRTRRRDASDLFLLFLFLLTLGLSLASIAQFHFMGSYFPKERLALSFIPPFMLLINFLFKSIDLNQGKKIAVLNLFPMLLAIVFLTHMLFSANVTYVLDWKYDANTKAIALDIEAIND
ncbi:MAG: glycosyltransferase family 39 protein, partial [Saprospiraceae bacterium]